MKSAPLLDAIKEICELEETNINRSLIIQRLQDTPFQFNPNTISIYLHRLTKEKFLTLMSRPKGGKESTYILYEKNHL